MTPAKHLPDEVEEYIRQNAAGITKKELTELVNEKFSHEHGAVYTLHQIDRCMRREGIKNGMQWKAAKRVYPVEMLDYIKSIAPGIPRKEIAKKVSEHYGIEFTVSKCEAYLKRHRIHNGLDGGFKKGSTPHNKGKKVSPEMYEIMRPTMFKPGHDNGKTKPIGELATTKEGYVIRKVRMDGGKRWERWQFEHRRIWEENCGPIPKDKIVIFLDGDKQNLSIDNLALVTRSENITINKMGLRGSAEITQAGIQFVRLQTAINRIKAAKHPAKSRKEGNNGRDGEGAAGATQKGQAD